MGTPPTVVELRGVSKAYGDVRALDDVTLTVRQGELLSLLGPSGCGKTTTLNVVAGFVSPDTGRVFVDGADVTDVPPYRRGLGVVFQSYALFPHMTVEENVAFGLRERGVPRREIATRVREALALVRLPGTAARRPRELSGGMQQRVALARALVIQPRVLLLDEPLAALDKKLREEMRAELKEIQQRVGVTTVFVTHDQHEALGLSDRIAVLNAGRLEQLGSPRDIYERPATRFVADFIGASTILEATAVGGTTVELAPGVRLEVKLDRLLTQGERVRLLVRPERIELGAAIGITGAVIGITGAGRDNAVAARVTRVMYLGDHTEVGLELAGRTRALATIRGGSPLAVGDSVAARLPPDALMELTG